MSCVCTGERRLPFHQRDVVQKMIQGMLQQGIIEPSGGAWASPIVLVRKKDGSYRFCVDFRRLNSVTKKDEHPLPRIDDALDTLSGSKWFSTCQNEQQLSCEWSPCVGSSITHY